MFEPLERRKQWLLDWCIDLVPMAREAVLLLERFGGTLSDYLYRDRLLIGGKRLDTFGCRPSMKDIYFSDAWADLPENEKKFFLIEISHKLGEAILIYSTVEELRDLLPGLQIFLLTLSEDEREQCGPIVNGMARYIKSYLQTLRAQPLQ